MKLTAIVAPGTGLYLLWNRICYIILIDMKSTQENCVYEA